MTRCDNDIIPGQINPSVFWSQTLKDLNQQTTNPAQSQRPHRVLRTDEGVFGRIVIWTTGSLALTAKSMCNKQRTDRR